MNSLNCGVFRDINFLDNLSKHVTWQANIKNVITMENRELVVTFCSVSGNQQTVHFGKLLVSTFILNTKFIYLLTSLRFYSNKNIP